MLSTTTTLERTRPLDVWAAGVEVAIRTLRREPVLALKRLALPVSYWRSAEFGYVWRQLAAAPGARVLDLGSPKDLAVMLARRRGLEIVATDILPDAIESSRRYARAQGLDGHGPGRVHSEVQDGRALAYADASFDAAFSVSVLEHIPDGGDAIALRELIRVTRPGGVIVVTVPYDRRYRETFVEGPVYERTPIASERVFFERHYDRDALDARLLPRDLCDVLDVSYWGEGAIRMEALLDRLGPLRVPLSPLEAFLSTALLRRVDPESDGHPMAAFVTLRRRAHACALSARSGGCGRTSSDRSRACGRRCCRPTSDSA
jgi:SAM-dependent methyltransferase